jgi:hypothetical protein
VAQRLAGAAARPGGADRSALRDRPRLLAAHAAEFVDALSAVNHPLSGRQQTGRLVEGIASAAELTTWCRCRNRCMCLPARGRVELFSPWRHGCPKLGHCQDGLVDSVLSEPTQDPFNGRHHHHRKRESEQCPSRSLTPPFDVSQNCDLDPQGDHPGPPASGDRRRSPSHRDAGAGGPGAAGGRSMSPVN